MDTNEKKDLNTEEDIRNMVDLFYDKVNSDNLLSPIFNDFAEVDWLHHLPRMYQFWNNLILGEPGYKGQPFPMHARLPITKAHFERWLELFKQNLEENYSGVNTELAKEKAENIAYIFQYRLGLIK